VISPEELDHFHGDLLVALRLYRRKTAVEVGQRALRDFAKTLDDRREGYEDGLSNDEAKVLLKAQRDAIGDLNSGMEDLAGLLRHLAPLVGWFREPEGSEGLSRPEADQALLKGKFDEIKATIASLMSKVFETKRVLLRQQGGGSGTSSPDAGSQRSYRRVPDPGRIESRGHLVTPTSPAGAGSPDGMRVA
jgi:hypothetical protein